MFWNSYLYRHVCALTPARLRIRKTEIQNIDEIRLTRNNDCLKVGEEKAFAGRSPHQQSEIQKWGGMKCRSNSTPLQLWVCGLVGDLFFWKGSEQHFRGILWTFLVCHSHIWHCYYRWKTELQRLVSSHSQKWKRMVPIKLLAKCR